MYEIHGDGPYFIYDKKSQRLVSMISFRTQAEAQAFIDMFPHEKEKDKDGKETT